MSIPPNPPKSKAPETSQIDQSWDDLIGSALGSDDSADDVFDRATAVPVSPQALLDLARAEDDLPPSRRNDPLRLPTRPPGVASEPPELGGRIPFRQAKERQRSASEGPELELASDRPPVAAKKDRLPLPGGGPGARTSLPGRRKTSPEPIVERFLDRLEAGEPQLAGRSRGRPTSEPQELELGAMGDSPLELAETYRRATESHPGRGDSDPGPAGSPARESGTLEDMQDRYAVGDFTGALVVAESILDGDPENADALRYAQSCREVLTQMYAARIGSMDQIATVAVPQEQITWLSLDHRAGFLLSLIDGISSIDEILDISGMSRLDALRIMYTLVQQNVVTLSH